MFAGPNGSGKSTIKSVLDPRLLYTYINPDEIEIEIKETGFFDVGRSGVSCTLGDVQRFFGESGLTRKSGLTKEIPHLAFKSDKIDFRGVEFNRYWPSIASDFLRHKLLETKSSFTFETVMSSPDKIEFLAKAQQLGYRTYLYYVATGDPEINVARVRSRVEFGGHDVPDDKIRDRYHRSLALLYEAFKYSYRAYFFDNSRAEGEHFLIASALDGELKIESEIGVPVWFTSALLDKLVSGDGRQ